MNAYDSYRKLMSYDYIKDYLEAHSSIYYVSLAEAILSNMIHKANDDNYVYDLYRETKIKLCKSFVKRTN